MIIIFIATNKNYYSHTEWHIIIYVQSCRPPSLLLGKKANIIYIVQLDS